MARSFALVTVLVAMVMAVQFASIADAKYNSYLRVYEQPLCRGRSEKYEACGCHNLKYDGGYKYDYNEKYDPESSVTLYKDYNCQGYGRTLLQADRERCWTIRYNSVYIHC
ncbi:antimicrobial peptide 1-like [Nymphaea colorata]|uniref:antimicrobial peptide 1-like n=1 Tax=Nymphaea colorata TaxID=210225 RepID=UPI00129DBE64|nr:antimicrobial peptide 1-like [Nymphaea colorata]